MLENEIFADLIALANGEPQWWGSPLHDGRWWGASSQFSKGDFVISIRVSSCPAANMPSIVGELVCKGVVESSIDWRMDDIYLDEYFKEDGLIRARLFDNETGGMSEILAKSIKFKVIATQAYSGRNEFYFDRDEYRKATISEDGAITRRGEDGNWGIVAYVPESDRRGG